MVTCLVVSTLAAVSVPADAFTLVKNGRSNYTIVLATDASPSERHAASELQKLIEEISGAKLPIAGEATKSNKMIILGACELQRRIAPDVDVSALGDEGFTVRTVGPNLVIAGGRLRGTMYGVCTFLEDVLGCRWYTSTVSKIPKTPTIRFGWLNITQRPDFEYREPYYTDAWDPDWAARNKVNGYSTRLDETRGGKISYNGFCHTFDSLVPTDKYFNDHPEYFSLLDGVRKGGQYEGQLCLTNPEVLRIVTDTVLKWISEKPELKIVSVTQNDNGNYCRCEKCAAVDAEEGSPSGLMLRFVNAVADEVAKKYPDHLIDTFAYQYTEKPPKITKPRPNVRVRLCSIDCCQYHPYETCPRSKTFVENLKGWHSITNNELYIWHYNTNFGFYMLPLPDLEELAADIPLYKRSGVVGMFCQGTYTAGNGPYGGGGWMDDLKQFLIAKMLWNTRVDVGKIRKDFLYGYYGKAGKPIGEYLDLLHDTLRNADIHGKVCATSLPQATFLTDEVMAESNRLFDKAEKLAGSPDELRRVKHSRLSVRFVEVSRQAAAAVSGSAGERKAALGKLRIFLKDCEADGIVRVSEGGRLRDWYESVAAPLR